MLEDNKPIITEIEKDTKDNINTRLNNLFGQINSNASQTTGGQVLDISKDILEKVRDKEWHQQNIEKYSFKVPEHENVDSKKLLFNIPNQVTSILSKDEDEYTNLTDLDKRRIKVAKKQGIEVSGKMMSQIKENLDMAIEEGYGLHSRQFLLYLNEQKIDFAMLDEKILQEYGKKYKIERRPPIHILIKFTLKILNEKFIEAISSFDISDENKYNLIESQEVRDNFVKVSLQNGKKIFEYDDFSPIKYYFDEYGFNVEDGERLNKDNVIREGAILDDYYKLFTERTGYDFIDVFTYFADKYKNKNSTDNNLEFINKGDIDTVNLKAAEVTTKMHIDDDIPVTEEIDF